MAGQRLRGNRMRHQLVLLAGSSGDQHYLSRRWQPVSLVSQPMSHKRSSQAIHNQMSIFNFCVTSVPICTYDIQIYTVGVKRRMISLLCLSFRAFQINRNLSLKSIWRYHGKALFYLIEMYCILNEKSKEEKGNGDQPMATMKSI